MSGDQLLGRIRTLFLVISVLLFGCLPTSAWRQGLNTTFDPARWGGPSAVSCLGPSIGGTCNTGYNATCAGGATDNATAYTNFVTANQGLTAVLYIPSGSTCLLGVAWGNSLRINNLGGNTTPIKDLTIWGYGAAWDANFLTNSFKTTGSFGFTVKGLINTANIGDTSITLKNIGDAANFAIGNWVCVCGLEMQHGGFPPNFQFYEYRKITNIVGAQVFFSGPLTNQYLSTWPQNDINDGPAAIWLMDSTWDSTTTIYGMRFIDDGSFAINFPGRSATINNVSIPSGSSFAPSSNQSFSCNGSFMGSPEIDKNIEVASFVSCSTSIMLFQNPSPNQLTIQGGTNSNIVGAPKNLSLTNANVPTIRLGPTGFGHGVSVAALNSTVSATTQNSGNLLVASTVAFSGGTFSISRTDPNRNLLLSWAVPNQKYYFGDSDGTPNCVNTPQSACTFKVTAVRGDGIDFATVTISNASPAVVTLANHGLTTGTPIIFAQPDGSGSDLMPSPLATNTQYFVKTVLNANTFTISATNGGAAINTTTNGSGPIVLSSGNFYADTDIGSVLPTPTCNTHACPVYAPYAAATVTQTNTGPADMTQFAAPP